jgi:hypothetical protein
MTGSDSSDPRSDGAPLLTAASRVRLLVVLLRLGGIVTVSAFGAILLPTDWMAGVHVAIGLGEFPRAPVVDYLARSIAALYGFHGVLLLIVSTDPRRYVTIVRYVAWMNALFGVMIIAIDLHAPMPMLWTALEGPPIVLFGIVIAQLNRPATE